MSSEHAQTVVATVERLHKKFRSFKVTTARGVATVQFYWIDVDPRTISGWFAAVGVVPTMTGRMLIEDDTPVDYGVVCFVEAA